MINKVILITGYKISDMDYKKYGFEEYEKQEFNVEVWDISPILMPKKYLYDTTKLEKHQNVKYLIFNENREVIKALNNLNKSVIICFAGSSGFSIKTFSFYRKVSKKEIPYYIMSNTRVGIKIKQKLKLQNIFKKLIKKSVFKLFIAPPVFCVIGGNTKNTYNYMIDRNKTDVLYLHSEDFERYLKKEKSNEDYKEQEIKSILNTEYIVFIDQNLPNHRDIMYLNDNINKESYYEKMNEFFDFLESKLELKVVIAAHPRTENSDEKFGNRLVIKGKTLELIENSSLVLLHYSTAVNYAVIFKKPLIFLLTKEILKNKRIAQAVISLAKQLESNTFLLENINRNTIIENKINKKQKLAYKRYQDKFIVHPQKKNYYRSMWIEVIDYIKKL